MKKTIREDRKRKVIKEEFLDDNTLLEVSVEEKKVIVSVRFVKSPVSGIKEHVLLITTPEEYLKHSEELISINAQRDTIAIFRKSEDDKYYLSDVYDCKEHSFEASDFADLLYKERFREKQLVKQPTQE